MIFTFPDGSQAQKPLLAKLAGLKRGCHRPCSVSFDAEELRQVYVRLADPEFQRWYCKTLVPAMKAVA